MGNIKVKALHENIISMQILLPLAWGDGQTSFRKWAVLYLYANSVSVQKKFMQLISRLQAKPITINTAFWSTIHIHTSNSIKTCHLRPLKIRLKLAIKGRWPPYRGEINMQYKILYQNCEWKLPVNVRWLFKRVTVKYRFYCTVCNVHRLQCN